MNPLGVTSAPTAGWVADIPNARYPQPRRSLVATMALPFGS